MAAWLRRGVPAPDYDPTFGDRELSDGCQDILMGRWEGARDLLEKTPGEWDRRAHCIKLLADAAAGLRTVDLWSASEPHHPDAAVLRAETEVMRMFGGARDGTMPDAATLDRAAWLCYQAIDLAPADPYPWVSLLALGRLYPRGHQHMKHWWSEVQSRDPYHREGHHQALRYLSARWHGSHGQALNFAWDAALYAPDGSSLAALPLVARAEHFRHRKETEGDNALFLNGHWNEGAVRNDLRAALDRWVAHRAVPAAQDVADLNHLAHGLVQAGMINEAGEIFTLLNNRATTVPWSFTGDAEAAYVQWRDRTSGTAKG
ncbi:hypothetical protein [Streptomyces sp. NBC_00829]|uniref:hypothetical protein n=1 Tax=Streptomyces sp. NBC_00829 TaxID=2903679 RepID=UPI00386315CA|nr:hypothetical protein OG293_34690 [Streptomyces sp. NBC_00829]